MKSSLQLRIMTVADLDFADWLRAFAGWNQTRAGWERLLAHEPEGCFVAEWEGSPAGTATTTCYGNELAWIGMVLVHPEYRRRGIGTALLQRCLDYVKNRHVRCIKLDATPLGRPVYERLGFQSEWSLARWEIGTMGSAVSNPKDDTTFPAGELREWRDGDEDAITQIDMQAFGVSRWKILACVRSGSSRSIVSVSSDGQIQGFAMLSQGAHASYLGPVVAVSPGAGRALATELITRARDRRLFWDIPESNLAAIALAREFGFVRQRPFLRMFRGDNANAGDPQMQFAIADPALG